MASIVRISLASIVTLAAACGSSMRPADDGAVVIDAAPHGDGATAPDVTAPDATAAPDVGLVPKMRVLFIGNSYTHVNDLPAVLAELGTASQSPVRFEVARYAPGGQTWEGHDADPAVKALIDEGWDYVVLQDQSGKPFVTTEPSSALVSLDAKVKATGAKTVLFMTWARADDGAEGGADLRFQQDMMVNYYYERHADLVGALVAPVGRAWERALRDPSTALHAADGSHPNELGTYLAACVFYATLTGQSPEGLGDGGLGIDTPTATKLQRVAAGTLHARAPLTPPLVGFWPLSASLDDSDLIPGGEVKLGDGAGPSATLPSATTFGRHRYAAVPYFSGLRTAHVTVSIHAYLPDWSVPVATQYLVGKWGTYALYREGTRLYARISTVDELEPAPISYAAAGLAAGWHHIALRYDGAKYSLLVDASEVASAATSGDLRHGLPTTYMGHFAGIAVAGQPAAAPPSIDGNYSGMGFAGALSGLRIYDTALTDAALQPL